MLKTEPDFQRRLPRRAEAARRRLRDRGALGGGRRTRSTWPGTAARSCSASARTATLVASDPAPLVAHTRDVIYLDDGEAAILHPDGFETRTLEGAPVSKRVQQIAFSLPDIERGGFPHFMLKEIAEQPESIRNALRGRIVRSEGTAKLGGVDGGPAAEDPALPHRGLRHLVARRPGRASTCWRTWHGSRPRSASAPSSATPTRCWSRTPWSSPSASPGRPPTRWPASVRPSSRGAETIGICNVVGSTIARECGKGIYIHAGPEIGVASTKAFTSQLVVLSLLAVHLGRMRGMSLRAGLLFLDALERLPDAGGADPRRRRRRSPRSRSKYASLPRTSCTSAGSTSTPSPWKER